MMTLFVRTIESVISSGIAAAMNPSFISECPLKNYLRAGVSNDMSDFIWNLSIHRQLSLNVYDGAQDYGLEVRVDIVGILYNSEHVLYEKSNLFASS